MPSACAAPISSGDGVIELRDVGPDQAGLGHEAENEIGVIRTGQFAPGPERTIAAVLEGRAREARVVAGYGAVNGMMTNAVSLSTGRRATMSRR